MLTPCLQRVSTLEKLYSAPRKYCPSNFWQRGFSSVSQDRQNFIQITPEIEEAIEKHVQSAEKRHRELCQATLDESKSHQEMASVNKELASLESSIVTIEALSQKGKEIAELETMIAEEGEDTGLLKMASEELKLVSSEKEALQQDLLRMLLPRDDAESRGCVLEVRAGSGGEEASLFAMNMFKMYQRYAESKGWKFECDSVSESGLGGFKEATASVSGEGAYGRLQFESGVHRVQRVPVTEKSGRIHTSASSVVVLPIPEEVDVTVRNEDLRIDTYRSGGAGGQSVNTTSSAVRVTHLPSGVVVAIQDERSQHMNKAKALKILGAKLYDMERRQLAESRSQKRSQQIGSGDRSERIRTYNFPQGRVTDHRINLTLHSLERVLAGEGLDELVDPLLAKREMELLETIVENT